jgi:hypothetical protein
MAFWPWERENSLDYGVTPSYVEPPDPGPAGGGPPPPPPPGDGGGGDPYFPVARENAEKPGEWNYQTPPYTGPRTPGYNWPDAPEFTPPDFQVPTAEGMFADPSYNFRLAEGQRALEQSAAAKGILRTGGTLRDILGFGQDFASQEYSNIFKTSTLRSSRPGSSAGCGSSARPSRRSSARGTSTRSESTTPGAVRRCSSSLGPRDVVALHGALRPRAV